MKYKKKALASLEKLNREFDRILEQVAKLHDDELIRKPSVTQWSVAQIYDHLFQVEQLTMKYVKYKQSENSTYPKEKFYTKIRFYAYIFLLASPFRFKAPATLSQPVNSGDLQSIETKFADLRAECHEFIQEQDPSYFKLATCKHTLVGRITFEKMLRFQRSHLRHHEKQIYRTLVALTKSN